MIAPVQSTVPKLLFTFPEAGEALACSEKTVSRMVSRGELRAVRIGRAVRISVDELRDFIALRQQFPAEAPK
jgi:excisionase family DNA binding protein